MYVFLAYLRMPTLILFVNTLGCLSHSLNECSQPVKLHYTTYCQVDLLYHHLFGHKYVYRTPCGRLAEFIFSTPICRNGSKERAPDAH